MVGHPLQRTFGIYLVQPRLRASTCARPSFRPRPSACLVLSSQLPFTSPLFYSDPYPFFVSSSGRFSGIGDQNACLRCGAWCPLDMPSLPSHQSLRPRTHTLHPDTGRFWCPASVPAILSTHPDPAVPHACTIVRARGKSLAGGDEDDGASSGAADSTFPEPTHLALGAAVHSMPQHPSSSPPRAFGSSARSVGPRRSRVREG